MKRTDHCDIGVGRESLETAPIRDSAWLTRCDDFNGTIAAEGVHYLTSGFEGFEHHETPNITNFLKLQAPNSFVTKIFEIKALSRSMTGTGKGGRFAPTAIRLRAVRRASVHPERKAFAEFLGITVPRLSNIENGHPLSRDVQDRVIAKMPWIARSWLVDGDEGALTGTWLQRLLPLVAEESDTTAPRSRSRGRSSL